MAILTELPKCDFCEDEARYDAATVYGSWANMCPKDFLNYAASPWLGVSKGQRLVLASERQWYEEED